MNSVAQHRIAQRSAVAGTHTTSSNHQREIGVQHGPRTLAFCSFRFLPLQLLVGDICCSHALRRFHVVEPRG